MGNAVMFKGISEVKQIYHLSFFITEQRKGEIHFFLQLFRLFRRIDGERKNGCIKRGVCIVFFLYFRQLVEAKGSPVPPVKHQFNS